MLSCASITCTKVVLQHEISTVSFISPLGLTLLVPTHTALISSFLLSKLLTERKDLAKQTILVLPEFSH